MSKPLRKLLGRHLVREREKFPLERIPTGTVLGLYFADDSAAGWEESLEKLMKFYEEMKRMDRLFDVILIPLQEGSTCAITVSSSSTEAEGCSNGSSSDSSLFADPSASSAPSTATTTTAAVCINASHPPSWFLSLEGKDARLKEEFLIRKYGVYHGSSLILIDSTLASVINFNGMPKISQDPKGLGFPFKKRPYSLILSNGPLISIKDSRKASRKHRSFQRRADEQGSHSTTVPSSPSKASSHAAAAGTSIGSRSNSTSDLPSSSFTTSPDYLNVYTEERKKHDFKGLFFGAHWCPPCRAFCSSLIQVYKRIKEDKKSFEVVYVSSDRSHESFDKFFSLMPWLAIPFEDAGRRQELTECFNVKAIPSLIIVDDQSEKIITSEGRLEINEDLEALDFPWWPKLVEELRDRHSSELNTSMCVIYFTTGDNDHEYERAEAILHSAAARIIESDLEEAFQPKFFIGTDSELSESLRLFIDLEENVSYMVFLDISRLKYCSFPASVFLDSHHVLEYVEKFRNSQLHCHRIRGHGRITI